MLDYRFWLLKMGVSVTKSSWLMDEQINSQFVQHATSGGPFTNPFPPILMQWKHDDPTGASARPGENFYALVGNSISVRTWSGKDYGTVLADST